MSNKIKRVQEAIRDAMGPDMPLGQPDPERVTLRDRLAMAALTGICAGDGVGRYSSDDLAKEAYIMADSMLAARSAKGEK